jgi:hypothetical protein
MTNHATDEELNDLVDAPHRGAEQRVHQHVAHCAQCQREVASIKSLLERSRSLDDPIVPPMDLWPGIAQAAPDVRRRVQRNRLSRLIPLAAAVAFVIAAASVGYLLSLRRDVSRGPQQAAAPSTQAATVSVIPDAALMRRAAIATGDSLFYDQRFDALADSLTDQDRAAMAASPTLAARRNEIDSLTRLVTALGRNNETVNALSRALDAWYFDVQQLRREIRRIGTAKPGLSK